MRAPVRCVSARRRAGAGLCLGETAKNEVENNSLVLVAPPPPLPGKTPTPVQDVLEGKPNLAEQIAKEVKASIAGAGQAVNSPAELINWLLEGFGIAKPIDPNSYVDFCDKKQIAKLLNTSVSDFHGKLKKEILDTFPNERAKIGARNPDIGVDSRGNIVLRNQQTKKLLPRIFH